MEDAKSPKAKRSYTYDALMRLTSIENCLVDMRRSRDTVMDNIEHILDREKDKLLLEREKSSTSLRLLLYQNDVNQQTKELEEERRRINSLHEKNLSRRAALEDAKKRYQTGYEYLEKVILNGVDVLSEALSVTSSRLCARQRELIADLLSIYPIEPTDENAFSLKILGIPLPNSVFNGCDDEKIATALGFTCHLIQMLAFYLAIPLRFPMSPMSSRSTIRDPISASIPASRQFPLYSKGVDRYQFEYAVFLLNKNIEQLMNSQGMLVMDLRHTLPNLKYLILTLTSSSTQALHYRKMIPHHCTIPNKDNSNNQIASNLDITYHTESTEPRSSPRSNMRSGETNGSRRLLAPIAIPKGGETKHRRTTGFQVGVT